MLLVIVGKRKKELREMLEKDEIYSVKRNYGDRSDFNRIK